MVMMDKRDVWSDHFKTFPEYCRQRNVDQIERIDGLGLYAGEQS